MEIDTKVIIERALQDLDINEYIVDSIKSAIKREINSLVYSAVKDNKRELGVIVNKALNVEERLLDARTEANL